MEPHGHDPDRNEQFTILPSLNFLKSLKYRYTTTQSRLLVRLRRQHAQTPYLRRVPLPALLIISLIALINCVVWAICGLILHNHGTLMATAALCYTLGLRHALDADHISAIDLMTRRLLASNPSSRPVTVGTWFSLGHSTIVVITSIVVAATAAGISKNFGTFGAVGATIGSSVSAGFLIVLGIMNGYILYKLIAQLNLILSMPLGYENSPTALNVEGGGPLFRILKKIFRLIDQPWKMYPLGILFGLGFDTSSEIALLGIASIQGSKGTSIWLILIFPILFTVGMCLIDTIDGALMLAVYVAPMSVSGFNDIKLPIREDIERDLQQPPADAVVEVNLDNESSPVADAQVNAERRLNDPIMFLYYSIVLTSLTVMVALVIGTIQLLTLILHLTNGTGPFWDGVQAAGDHYEIIGGGICASFLVVGGASILCYRPWRRMIERSRCRDTGDGEENKGKMKDSGAGKGLIHESDGLANDEKYNHVEMVVVQEIDDDILGEGGVQKDIESQPNTITPGEPSKNRALEPIDDRIELA